MYLVVGAGGFLGSYIIRETEKRNKKAVAAARDASGHNDTGNTRWFPLDVTDKSSIERLKEFLDGEELCVFYLAACHNIDFVYENPDFAYNVNVTALESFLNSGLNIKKLFFASTDCVYGENTAKIPAFFETDEGKPVNAYGEQKAMAERVVLSHGFTVLRLPFMTGPSLIPDKKHFYDNICNSLKNGQKVEMVDGLYRSALSYGRAADIIYRLSVRENLPDVINVCSDRGYTKYETGCIIAKENGLDVSLITSLTEKEGEKFFRDKRASSTVMDNTLLKKILSEKEFLFEAQVI
ncbi:MAG: NAD-dependent epimerase/dehydratase family protein [Clostridia bacterium]|nr:NAD-dependent epimerase/dehydratase family protein [Clostridia bacterium]